MTRNNTGSGSDFPAVYLFSISLSFISLLAVWLGLAVPFSPFVPAKRKIRNLFKLGVVHHSATLVHGCIVAVWGLEMGLTVNS